MEIFIIVLLCASTLSAASLKARMPLREKNLRSHLVAELDISDINKQIKEYIDSNVENHVNDTLQAQIDPIVNNKISELKAEMLKDFAKSMDETKDKYGNELKKVMQKIESGLLQVEDDAKKYFNDFKQSMIAIKGDVVKETKQKLEELKKDSVFDKPVAVTSCSSGGKTSYGEVIKFDNVVTQTGLNGISEFKTTGKFTCEKAGLYLISVHIASSVSGAAYHIKQNNVLLSHVYVGDHPSYDWSYTGTGTVTVQLQSGDLVWVQAGSSFYVYGGWYSCMSFVKIK